jgi:hypothetical protein
MDPPTRSKGFGSVVEFRKPQALGRPT